MRRLVPGEEQNPGTLQTMIWQEEIHKHAAESSPSVVYSPMSKCGVKYFSLKKNKLVLLLFESVTLPPAHVT